MNLAVLVYNKIFVTEKNTNVLEKVMLLVQIIGLVVMSFFGGNTDICGHLGGFIAGSIMFHRDLIKEYCCFECQDENKVLLGLPCKFENKTYLIYRKIVEI